MTIPENPINRTGSRLAITHGPSSFFHKKCAAENNRFRSFSITLCRPLLKFMFKRLLYGLTYGRKYRKWFSAFRSCLGGDRTPKKTLNSAHWIWRYREEVECSLDPSVVEGNDCKRRLNSDILFWTGSNKRMTLLLIVNRGSHSVWRKKNHESICILESE